VFGQPDKLRTLSRVTPLYGLRPDVLTNIQITVSAGQTIGYGSMGAPTATINSNHRFDLLNKTGITGSFFRFKHLGDRDYELLGFDTDPNLTPAGAK
jgi:hypothetical protein